MLSNIQLIKILENNRLELEAGGAIGAMAECRS